MRTLIDAPCLERGLFLNRKEWRPARPPSWGRRELRDSCLFSNQLEIPTPRNDIKYNPVYV